MSQNDPHQRGHVQVSSSPPGVVLQFLPPARKPRRRVTRTVGGATEVHRSDSSHEMLKSNVTKCPLEAARCVRWMPHETPANITGYAPPRTARDLENQPLKHKSTSKGFFTPRSIGLSFRPLNCNKSATQYAITPALAPRAQATDLLSQSGRSAADRP